MANDKQTVFVSSETPCTYNVRLGSSNWLYDDEGKHVDISVQAIYRHPDYGTYYQRIYKI